MGMWKNPNMGTALTAGANTITALGSNFAPPVYDPRIGMAKPNPLGTMTNFQLAGTGAAFGGVGMAIGGGLDVLKNLYSLQQQNKAYNEATNKADFYDNQSTRLGMMQPDFTQMMKKGGMAQYNAGGMVPAQMEANEIVLIPQPDGSYTEYMQTGANAPTHEQGGVNTQLPPGAIVFPAQYVQQVKSALAQGDFASISQMAQQMLQEGEQAKQQGQPYTSGAGGELPPAQQQQAQQMPQQQGAGDMMSGMIPPSMRCGGMMKRKEYAGGGIVPDMMQSDDYATVKARQEEEEKARLLAQQKEAANTQSYQQERELEADNYFENPNTQRLKSNPFPSAFNANKSEDMKSAENIVDMSLASLSSQNPTDKKGGFSIKGDNVPNYNDKSKYDNAQYKTTDGEYYDQKYKDERNKAYKAEGKTNPDLLHNPNSQNVPAVNISINTGGTNEVATTGRQDRNTSRQQAMKAGVYANSRWDEKTGQRMVNINGKEEVFDQNKDYSKVANPSTETPKTQGKAKLLPAKTADKKAVSSKMEPAQKKSEPVKWENPLNKAVREESQKPKANTVKTQRVQGDNYTLDIPEASKMNTITDKDRADIGGMVREKMGEMKEKEQVKNNFVSGLSKLGDKELKNRLDRISSVADAISTNLIKNETFVILEEYYRNAMGGTGQILDIATAKKVAAAYAKDLGSAAKSRNLK